MKQGRELSELVREIERQEHSKEDFIADTSAVRFDEDGVHLRVSGEEYPLRDLPHRQIGERVGIPYKYYAKMRDEAPELLATNINHWFQHKPEKRMIRLMDGEVRAFLSDRYQRRDNFNMFRYIFPVLDEIGNLELKSSELTEGKFYMKLTTPEIQEEVRKGDVVQAGLVISNSEVGLGAFSVQPLIYRLVCDNGMIAADRSFRKYHVGRRISTDEDIQMLYSDEALAADEHAFWLKARDVVKSALDEDIFYSLVAEMSQAAEREIRIEPRDAVQRLGKKHQLNQSETDGVLQNLLYESDFTQFGTVNALTRFSKEVEDYDRATEIEATAGQVLTLSPSEWKEIAA